MCFSSSILMNYPLPSALSYKERRLDLKQLVVTVTFLAVATGFLNGLGGSHMLHHASLSDVEIWLWVMYDATGVRLHARRQAEVLNQIMYGLPAEHPLGKSRPLHELLGYTTPQVIAGGLLGIVTAAVGHLITVICN
ncbi:hypothetical protein ACJRO7_012663 [Eucalyptus globulus]|uniref:Uncharacterized protein n=1 Tax=Eucalyptus globulus TaxID=34317 RepID=A0ABD3LJ91_EUCGL